MKPRNKLIFRVVTYLILITPACVRDSKVDLSYDGKQCAILRQWVTSREMATPHNDHWHRLGMLHKSSTYYYVALKKYQSRRRVNQLIRQKRDSPGLPLFTANHWDMQVSKAQSRPARRKRQENVIGKISGGRNRKDIRWLIRYLGFFA